jgi:uncharacterized protein
MNNSTRIHEIDALRGIALYGILLVNIFVFHAPYAHYGEFYGAFQGLNADVVDLVVEFAGGKFMFIFAFLFGYGIQLQSQNQTRHFPSYFSKRMLWLFIFGALHILLFWFGDILASYALIGVCIMPCIRLNNRNLLFLGIFFLMFRPIYYLGTSLFDWPFAKMAETVDLDSYLNTFQHGGYWDIFTLRMKEFIAFAPENLVWYISKTVGLFLIGIYAARKNLTVLIRTYNKLFTLSVFVFITAYILWVSQKMDFFRSFDLEAVPAYRSMLIGINIVFESMLGIAYIIGFLLLFQTIPKLSMFLAKTGKLALTNYILQSLICVVLFYGFGFGFYGKLSPSALVIIASGIFAFNTIFSYLYLKYNELGPLEKLWRVLINVKLLPAKDQKTKE